jgi:hypothetical protein
MVLLALLVALTGTGYGAWQAIKFRGETPQIVSSESRVPRSDQLSALWYSKTGELYGYRQEGWKVTLLRWTSDGESVPFSLGLDLNALTPLESNELVDKGNSGQSFSGNPYVGSYGRPQQNSPQQASAGAQTTSPLALDSGLPVSRSAATPFVTVSENLLNVVWAWRGKLYWTLVGEHLSETKRPPGWDFLDRSDEPEAAVLWDSRFAMPFGKSRRKSLKAPRSKLKLQAVSMVQNQAPRIKQAAAVFRLPPKIVQLVGLQFAGSTGLILQDESSQEIFLFDLKDGTTIASYKAATPCLASESSARALIACPSTPSAMLLDLSTWPHVARKDLEVPESKGHGLGFTILALSKDGTPAVATDLGTVLYWPSDKSGYRALRQLSSPGVGQSVDCDGQSVLVGGGFRGIYQLKEGEPPKLVVNDVTGTTLLALKSLEGTPEGLKSGVMAFGTRQGVGVARLSEVRRLNKWGYVIAGSWLGFWGLSLIGFPLLSLLIGEGRRSREVRLREELEWKLNPVATSGVAGFTAALEEPPDKLVEACASGKCVAFVGAGLGAQAGLPTWRPMIQSLLTEATRQKLLEPGQSATLQAALAEGQWNVVADELVDKLAGHEGAVQRFLSQTYLRQDIHPTPVHSLLRSLNLSGILSTTFDNLLETTFREQVKTAYTQEDSGKLLELLTKQQFFVAKLYGSLDKPGSVLLAKSQFEAAIVGNPLFSRFMEMLFFSRTLFFIGAGYEGIESYLSGLKISSATEPKHFALIAAKGRASRATADLLRRRYGIEVLSFSPQADFSDVERFLGQLVSAVQSRLPRSSAQSGSSRKSEVISRLQTVTLRNIGPFDDLTLDFDSQWTILLGDNGVGKSTVLRAIAVGLAGSDAADFAGRLIKSGKEAEGATITLRTSQGEEYRTIISKGDRTIVQSQTSRAIEAERWLALGFPPLRSFSLTPSELPAKGLARLTSEDLMPLIRGEVDPRLDKLKAWIIDLDYRDKASRASNPSLLSYFRPGQSTTQFTRLLDQFFEVIRRLTPGLKLGKVDIDPVKKEVRLETDDGVLRIESVSQGTQSLLGWVGVLLQRLNDFYTASGDSRRSRGNESSSLLDQYALVLMDEIDAHMHPVWQKLIVKSLRDLFPNAQFIATTHSPLVVSSLRKENIKLFSRDFNSRKVRVETPTSAFEGMRSDQILTSDLFGLQTTRSQETVEGIHRLSELLALKSRSDTEERELKELRSTLDTKLWQGETETEMEVERAIQKVILETRPPRSEETFTNLKEIPIDVAFEIRRQLGELLRKGGGQDK